MTHKDSKSNGSESGNSNSHNFLVVGIGASAGGVKAVREFFAAMPPNTGMAFVVILHLSPTHISNLDKIIRNETQMPVIQVSETVRVEPNHVYVIPPERHLVMIDGTIKLAKRKDEFGSRIAIDLFLRTLAESYGRKAMCVILSGTGTDGTLGLRAIKGRNGFAVVQSPEDAEYDGMPRSAIATKLADVVLPAAEIPAKLLSVRESSQKFRLIEEDEEEEKVAAAEIRGLDALREILTILRGRTGHDFSNYKHPTLLRRIARHLQIHELDDMQAYAELLRERPEEVQSLLHNLLINVTNFFRDKSAFDALEREIVPQIFAGKTATEQVRVWVAGGASGEEAYSIGMLLCEYAGQLASPPKIQIFATDVDEEAIAQAREGRFLEAIETDVSPERLKRFFTREANFYRVKKNLRELVLFAPHNVLRDPPFSRVDLVSCRNLLIYLNRETQQKVLQVFHFALRHNGYLFLGTSESADSETSLYVPLDKKNRLYMRSGSQSTPAITATPVLPLAGKWQIDLPETVPLSRERSFSYGELHYKLIEQYAPPSVLVNDDFEIVHISESAGRFLHFVGGEPTNNLLKTVKKDLLPDLRAALFSAQRERKLVEFQNIRIKIDGEPRFVNLIVRPVDVSETGGGFMLVTFDENETPEAMIDHAARPAQTIAADDAIETVIRRLEDELRRTKDRLRSTIEQHETSVEELKASNEELQAINEELRSASEELETSKEELQSVNEELTTVNHELKEKVDELGKANSDLQNLMASTDIGTIFLDRELQIKSFTPPAAALFNIISSDIGRPLKHLTNKLDYAHLTEDAARVLQRLKTVEHEIRGHDGRYFIARFLPYRTTDDHIDGVVLNFIDVTERRHAEEALRKSEELLRRAMEIETVGIVFFKNDGSIRQANEAFLKMSGFTRDDLNNDLLKWNEITPPEFMPKSLNAIKELEDLGRTTPYERQFIRKDGSRWWGLSAATLIGEGGSVEYVIDITDRKSKEEELREWEERYRIALEAAELAAWDWYLETDAAVWSDQHFLLLGLKPEKRKISADDFLRFVQPDDVENVRRSFERAVNETGVFKEEFRIIRADDGEIRWLSGYGQVVERNEGKATRMSGTMFDVTERKKAEVELHRNEEWLQMVLESVRDYAIFTMDSDGIINSWNTGAENIFGWTEKEAVGQTGEIIFTPEDRAARAPEQEMKTARELGRAMDERWHLRKDNSRFYVSGVTSPLYDESGKLLGYVKVARDLTERRQMEETLRFADRRKDEFLATLAHELRNPLAPVRSGLEIIRRQIDDRETIEKTLGIVERQTDQIVHLVDDLLEISRITQGKIKLRKEPVEIKQAIELALETSRGFLEKHRHRFTLTLPDEPIYIDGDPTRLSQIFLNLLNNAAKYTKPGGQIRLQAERVDGEVVVSLEDNGIGIPPEMLPHIFEVFGQVVPVDEKPQSGLGIGLSVVRKLVEMHGGTVVAASEGEGKGSKFIVRLPIVEAPAQKPVESEAPKPSGNNRTCKILAVDDNIDAVRMLEVLLTLEGHEVVTALDGKTALKAAEKEKPNAVLLDIGLPEMSGYEVARRLRGQYPDLILIAISGWGQDEDRRRSKEAGFDYHLVKPVRFEELQELLNEKLSC